MISAYALTKVYRTTSVETTALNGVSLEVEAGEFISIMGPSGCGKSTLLNVLGFLDTPTDGDYRFRGQAVAGLSERDRTRLRRGNIGFIFQAFNLIDELTVAENVELPLIYSDWTRSDRAELVERALARARIGHRRDHYPQELSGGQQQRVAIGRAVVAQPQLILADEPTGNLDSANSSEIMDLLSDLNAGGTTIVMVTHAATDASYSGRTVRLFDGEVVGEDITQPFTSKHVPGSSSRTNPSVTDQRDLRQAAPAHGDLSVPTGSGQ